MYGSYISVSRTVSEYLNLNSVVSHGVLCVHANEHIAVYPPVQPYTSTTNHVTISARWLYGDQAGTSLDAFINVQPRIYFIALYVNPVELCRIFYNSYHTYEFFQGKDQKKNDDWRGWMLPRGREMWWISFQCSVLFLYTFYCIFFSFWIQHNPSQHWRATPASHQGGIQTLSISHSNSCIWQVPVRHPNAFQLSVKTPPCLLFIADPPAPPRPDTTPPLQLCSLSPLPLAGGLLFFFCTPDAVVRPGCPRVDSTPLKCSLCHRCVFVPNMCFSDG